MRSRWRFKELADLVFHSDRGSQYTSTEFSDLCDSHGILQSMGATGVCWDNAAAESFSETLKREHANKRRLATRADVRRDLIRTNLQFGVRPQNCKLGRRRDAAATAC